MSKLTFTLIIKRILKIYISNIIIYVSTWINLLNVFQVFTRWKRHCQMFQVAQPVQKRFQIRAYYFKRQSIEGGLKVNRKGEKW